MSEDEVRDELRCIRLCQNIQLARLAITLRRPKWKKGQVTFSSHEDCPVCGGVGTLAYSIAGHNGHILASCGTKGCVSWME